MIIELPWPPKELSPNSTAKLRDKMRAKKYYRELCWALAKVEYAQVHTMPSSINLEMTFFPPDKRKRDLDNAFAAMKYGIDGISKAIGIDDSEFGYVLRPLQEPVKPGKVVVTI